MSAPVDARRVLMRIAKEWGMDPPIRAELKEAHDGIDELIKEGTKIEVNIHSLGLACPRFTAALDRASGGVR